MENKDPIPISSLLGASYLSKFKVRHDVTLFPPDWEALAHGRCPLCNCKLKYPIHKQIVICNSKKHRYPFIIKVETLKELTK